MKSFIFKSVIISLPLVLLTLISYLWYDTTNGDIIRAGYIFNSYPEYRKTFEDVNLADKYYYDYLENDTLREFDVLSIGDSFSEQGIYGYQNYLSKEHGLKILHFNWRFHGNPIQTLFALSNGDFFDKYKIKFVVLEVVERHFLESGLGISKDSILNISNIVDIYDNNYSYPNQNLLSSRIFKFPYFSINRLFSVEKPISKVYEFKSKSNNFSVPSKSVFVYRKDIDNLKFNNSFKLLSEVHSNLSDLYDNLNKKGVSLIVLPAPNKFSFYYDDLDFIGLFDEPVFFQNYRLLAKPYAFLDPLDSAIIETVNFNDFYFYDDSHWSPRGSKFIALQLSKVIF